MVQNFDIIKPDTKFQEALICNSVKNQTNVPWDRQMDRQSEKGKVSF